MSKFLLRLICPCLKKGMLVIDQVPVWLSSSRITDLLKPTDLLLWKSSESLASACLPCSSPLLLYYSIVFPYATCKMYSLRKCYNYNSDTWYN